VTADQYQRAFDYARSLSFPAMDDFEAQCGYALDRERMESAARVLACPVKANPPNWQHGRMVYAATRRYLSNAIGPVSMLDVGTAKGFSALCLEWARRDACVDGHVVSLDVLDPHERVRRNTVAEVDGYKTLAEILDPWPDSKAITFLGVPGLVWLKTQRDRVHVAFIDGKHSADVVRLEGQRMAELQEAGDLVMFDDLQIEGVAKAVKDLSPLYAIERLTLSPGRVYAVGYRRG